MCGTATTLVAAASKPPFIPRPSKAHTCLLSRCHGHAQSHTPTNQTNSPAAPAPSSCSASIIGWNSRVNIMSSTACTSSTRGLRSSAWLFVCGCVQRGGISVELLSTCFDAVKPAVFAFLSPPPTPPHPFLYARSPSPRSCRHPRLPLNTQQPRRCCSHSFHSRPPPSPHPSLPQHPSLPHPEQVARCLVQPLIALLLLHGVAGRGAGHQVAKVRLNPAAEVLHLVVCVCLCVCMHICVCVIAVWCERNGGGVGWLSVVGCNNT